MTRVEYLRREDRKRIGSSLAVALAAYAAVAGAVFFSGLLSLSNLGDVPKTVWVDIGSSADLQGGIAKGGDVPAPRGAPQPQPLNPSKESTAPVVAKAPTPAARAPSPAASPAKAEAAKAPAAASSAAGATSPAAAVPASAASSASASLPTDGANAAPGEAWTPGPRPAGSHVISTASGVGAGTSGAGEASAAGAFSTKVVGNEKGNSLETVLGVGAGKSGRSLYVPIYLYMPLPKTLTDKVVLGAASYLEARKDLILSIYKRINEEWVLSRKVPVEQRDEIWIALEKGGYDVAHADYKAGGSLAPVTLSFVVTPATPTSPPSLQAVTITESSGDPAVDEAVLYGFKRASFFNATDGTISGTFVYGFGN
ncbi:MAG TPA: energy transducer TonB [Rectinemataceae bacterium]|nr:energy transducer TonB [Rectinemataceae bacterium]